MDFEFCSNLIAAVFHLKIRDRAVFSKKKFDEYTTIPRTEEYVMHDTDTNG
jgi:hypothetical protein